MRLYTPLGETVTILEIIAEQRRCSLSANPAERFAAALLLPGVLRDRLRELTDFRLGQVLDREVCNNLSVLSPELTVCMQAAERLCRRPPVKFMPRRRWQSSRNDGDHILHAEAALYRGRIPHLLLPFQRDKFASNVFLVPSVAEARECLRDAGFREARWSPSLLVDRETHLPIRLMERAL